jgi:aryl-alcohol dehydrogenase-like predicted oxidoreductase
MLTGKYAHTDRPEEGTRVAITAQFTLKRYWHDRGFAVIDALKKAADEAGKSPAQIALAWLLHDRRVTSVIIGSRKVEQLSDNLDAGEWDMPDELWRQLEQSASFDHGYPRSWMNSVYPRTFGEEEF